MTSLKTVNDSVTIAPEALEVANCYLQTNSVRETAEILGLPMNEVSTYLNKREVKAYIDTVFLDVGYRNKAKLATVLDKLIDDKLEEMKENETTTTKDIVDLLQMAHKMRMDEINAQSKLLEAQNKADSIKHQTNIQINEAGGSNYGSLLETLLKK